MPGITAPLRTRLGWVRLAGLFMVGQGIVQLVNTAAGLMIVRLLPVDEYAFYTLGMTLVTLLVFASNPGVSHAVITQGAAHGSDRTATGGLVRAALSISHRLYAAALPVFALVAALMLWGHGWSAGAKVVVVIIVAAMGWVRVPTMIATSVLNLRHDSRGLFLVGMAEGLVRLLLIPLCFLWPSAVTALSVGLLGLWLARWTCLRHTQAAIDWTAVSTADQRNGLRRFILPLMPIAIYSAFQGQIAVLILSFVGSTSSIANLGAVTRLGQILSVGTLLLPFMVQPIMARQIDRTRFLNRLALIVAGLAVASTLVIASAYVAPGWWLWILGRSYQNLERELPVTLAAGMLTLIGGTLYTVVISRNRTAGQYWVILPSVLGQVIFAALHGVATTYDALVLTLIPVVSYALVQAALLVRVVREWPARPAVG